MINLHCQILIDVWWCVSNECICLLNSKRVLSENKEWTSAIKRKKESERERERKSYFFRCLLINSTAIFSIFHLSSMIIRWYWIMCLDTMTKLPNRPSIYHIVIGYIWVRTAHCHQALSSSLCTYITLTAARFNRFKIHIINSQNTQTNTTHIHFLSSYSLDPHVSICWNFCPSLEP